MKKSLCVCRRSKKHFPQKVDFRAPDVEKRLSTVKKLFVEIIRLLRIPLH